MTLEEHSDSRRPLALLAFASAASAQWTLENNNTPAAIRTITRSSVGLVRRSRWAEAPTRSRVWGRHEQRGELGATSARWRARRRSSTATPASLSDGGTLVVLRLPRADGQPLPDHGVPQHGRRRLVGPTTARWPRTTAACFSARLTFGSRATATCSATTTPSRLPTDAGQSRQANGFMENARPKFSYGMAWTTYAGVASRPSNPGHVRARRPLVRGQPRGERHDARVRERRSREHGPERASTRSCRTTTATPGDYASRQEIWAPTKNGVQFNAYCPLAIRLRRRAGGDRVLHGR